MELKNRKDGQPINCTSHRDVTRDERAVTSQHAEGRSFSRRIEDTVESSTNMSGMVLCQVVVLLTTLSLSQSGECFASLLFVCFGSNFFSSKDLWRSFVMISFHVRANVQNWVKVETSNGNIVHEPQKGINGTCSSAPSKGELPIEKLQSRPDSHVNESDPRFLG